MNFRLTRRKDHPGNQNRLGHEDSDQHPLAEPQEGAEADERGEHPQFQRRVGKRSVRVDDQIGDDRGDQRGRDTTYEDERVRSSDIRPPR